VFVRRAGRAFGYGRQGSNERALSGPLLDDQSEVFASRYQSQRGLAMKIALVCVGALASLLFGASSLPAQGEQIFKGKICLGPDGRTPTTINGEVSLPCTVPHPKSGAGYILFNPETKTTYRLDPRGKAKAFAGRKVVVLGVLDQGASTVHVDEILIALPAKIAEAKSVYIDCDNCLRGMAAAWKAAFEVLEDWGRYDVTPDAKKADLIFLFSANPYLGDYVTRDGPDTRPVKVDITYMNVVDPQTGADLWGDSRHWGSFMVARATRSLIEQLRTQLALEKQPDLQKFAGKGRDRKTSAPFGN
jgi:hypothetical protein